LMKQASMVVGLWLMIATTAQAALLVNISTPKTTGSRAIVGLELENTFNQKIESVRAVMFLLNDQGKVVGQDARWIIGGSKDKPALAPAGKAKYNFVITTNKPFTIPTKCG